MRKSITAILAILGTAGSILLPTLPAQASSASAHAYANCAAVHRVYSGGIARAGVHYNRVSGHNRALKGTVKHSTALYNANKKLDRDHDGVACEKS